MASGFYTRQLLGRNVRPPVVQRSISSVALENFTGSSQSSFLQASPPPASGPTLFIRPAAHGDGSGSSWANSGAWSNLASFIASLATINDANRTIYVQADDGNYTGITTQTITAGGTHTNSLISNNTGTIASCSTDIPPRPWQRINPSYDATKMISIIGVDVNLNLMQATIVGTRQGPTGNNPWVLPPDAPIQWIVGGVALPSRMDCPVSNGFGWASGGNDALRFGTGAQDLRFRYLMFKNFRIPFIRNTNAVILNIEMDHVDFYNVRLFIDTSTNDLGGFQGLYIHDLTGTGHSKAGIDIRGNLNAHHLYQDCHINSGRISGDAFAQCFFFDGGDDACWHRCSGRNTQFSTNGGRAGDYWNGEAFDSEGTNGNGVTSSRHQWLACEGYGNSDAAIDHKAFDSYNVDFYGEDNMRNFRGFSPTTIIRPTSVNPYKRGGNGGMAHYFATSTDNITEIFSPTATGGGAVGYQTNDGAQMHIHDATGVVSTATSGSPLGIPPTFD